MFGQEIAIFVEVTQGTSLYRGTFPRQANHFNTTRYFHDYSSLFFLSFFLSDVSFVQARDYYKHGGVCGTLTLANCDTHCRRRLYIPMDR
jgi:hypothetical protein